MRWRNLKDERDREALVARLAQLRPDASPRWGRMSCPEMVSHVCDAFRLALRAEDASLLKVPMPRPLMRLVAFRVPAPWPKGFPAPTRIRQGRGGTPPGEFERDLETAIELTRKVATELPRLAGVQHPIFGRLSAWEWGRWAFLHTDHHLRQFGV
jgi:hypothetical protein